MEMRRFGATDLQVSALGLGCAALGSRTGRRPAERAVAQAADYGINVFDTAPFYGQGESERIIGRVFAGRRDKLVVATKIGLYPSLSLRVAARFKPVVRSLLKALPGVGRHAMQKSVQGFMRSRNEVRFDPTSIVTSVEASLRRLRTDYIDLLLLHVTPQPQQIPQVVEQLQLLRQQGKIRYYGASSSGIEETRAWLDLKDSGVAALQVMLNLFEIPVIDACLPLAARDGVAIMAREPFAQGRLLAPKADASGKLGFVGAAYDARFEPVATATGKSVPQIAIQFLAQTPGVSVVLAGMSNVEHLRQNVEALDLAPLSAAELTRLHELAPK